MPARLVRTLITVGIVVAAVLTYSGPTREGPRGLVLPRYATVQAVLSGNVVTLAERGQKVTAGQALAVVRTRFGSSVTARSPFTGIVVSVKVAVGRRVSVGEEILILRH